MSSILGAPPPSIQIPGGPGGPGGPPGGPGGPGGPPGGPGGGPVADALDDDSTPPDSDASQVTSLLRQALLNVQKAARLEADDADAASLSKIAADLHKAISMEQTNNDALSGAGPAVKALRKARPLPGPAGGGGPPGPMGGPGAGPY